MSTVNIRATVKPQLSLQTPEISGATHRPHWTHFLLAISFAPLVFAHFVQMLAKPHYQYVLLVPIGLCLVVRRRLHRARSGEAGRPVLTGLGLLVGWLAQCAATLIWSPWLGIVAGLVTCLTVIYATGGWESMKSLFPVWVLAWFVLPLPFGLDERVTSRLRTVTTTLTSLVLDELGILHLRAVNVIELPNKPLFIADACSGINSLFVILAFGAFLAVWNRRTLIHGLLLLGAGLGLVLVENVTRLVCIAVAAHFGWDLTEGVPHESLGAVLFGVTVLLVVSTDQLLMFLLPHHRWFKTFGLSSSRDHPSNDARGATRLGVELPGAKLAMMGFLALACLQLWILWNEHSGLRALFAKPVSFPKFTAETMPTDLAGFQRQNFRYQHRAPDDPLGAHSQAWIYERNGVSVVVSLDYPYAGLHDLTVCYQNIGWVVQDSHFVGENGPTTFPAADPNAFVESELRRSFYGHGLLLFSLCDHERPGWVRLKTTEVQSIPERLSRRLKLQWTRKAPEKQPGIPMPGGSWFQIEAMARSAVPFTAQQKEDCRVLFREARQFLYARCLKELERSS